MRSFQKSMAAVSAVLLLSMLVACSTLGLSPLKTFNERMTGGYSSVTNINNTTVILLNSKVIGSNDAQNVRDQTKIAKEGLDITKTLKGVEAEDKLNATVKVLTALEGYLATKQKAIK